MTGSGFCATTVRIPPPRSTGKERDAESGNDYFGVRYYASSMGRMLSPDPSQLYYADPTNPQSFNLYAYVRNNPLTSIDPDGLRCVWEDGSFDSEDDKDTGSKAQCEGGTNGGKWYDPGTYAVGTDWASIDQDGNLTFHVDGNGSNDPQPSVPQALTDLVSSSIDGVLLNTVMVGPHDLPANRFDTPYRLFSARYCGPGGAGTTTGAIDEACKAHDACYKAAGITAAYNFPGGPTMSSSQAEAAQGCNQMLYDAARKNNSAPGSKAAQYWLTNGANLPFGGYVIRPGTEARPW